MDICYTLCDFQAGRRVGKGCVEGGWGNEIGVHGQWHLQLTCRTYPRPSRPILAHPGQPGQPALPALPAPIPANPANPAGQPEAMGRGSSGDRDTRVRFQSKVTALRAPPAWPPSIVVKFTATLEDVKNRLALCRKRNQSVHTCTRRRNKCASLPRQHQPRTNQGDVGFQ